MGTPSTLTSVLTSTNSSCKPGLEPALHDLGLTPNQTAFPFMLSWIGTQIIPLPTVSFYGENKFQESVNGEVRACGAEVMGRKGTATCVLCSVVPGLIPREPLVMCHEHEACIWLGRSFGQQRWLGPHSHCSWSTEV
jgi:hypothetical protein